MNLAQACGVLLVASMVGGLALGINFGLVQGQSAIPTPSVPSFALYYVDHPYDVAPVAPTYTTNPYTGETQQTSPGSPGYHVDNTSIELWILNQQYIYYSNYHLYYDVRTRGHFEQNWTDVYPTEQRMRTANWTDLHHTSKIPPQCNQTPYTLSSRFQPPHHLSMSIRKLTIRQTPRSISKSRHSWDTIQNLSKTNTS